EYVFFTDLGSVRRVRPGGGMAETIASGDGAVTSLAIHGEWLYWQAPFGRLRRISRGVGLAETVRSEINTTGPIAVIDDSVYAFVPGHGVMKWSNRIESPSRVFASDSLAARLVAHDGALYLVTAGVRRSRRSLTPSTGMVVRFGLGGEDPIVLASGQNVSTS